MEIVRTNSPLEAWITGCQILIDQGDFFNLITEIDNPVPYDSLWFSDYDPASLQKGIASLSDVVTTIFPYKYATQNLNRLDLYTKYLGVHKRAKRIHKNTKRSWGTYFERMISFGDNHENQLERIINAINTWAVTPKAAFVIHISSADTDRPKKMGAPCLQYIEILRTNTNTLSMLAVYRNHDYFQKALGNFIGLGQLLYFICAETGKTPGSLTCHSAHVFHQTSNMRLKQLARI